MSPMGGSSSFRKTEFRYSVLMEGTAKCSTPGWTEPWPIDMVYGEASLPWQGIGTG